MPSEGDNRVVARSSATRGRERGLSATVIGAGSTSTTWAPPARLGALGGGGLLDGELGADRPARLATNASAAGERKRSRCHDDREIGRGGTGSPRGTTATSRSLGSTMSRGTSATPSPSATTPWTVPLSSERKTTFGSGPAPRRCVVRPADRAAGAVGRRAAARRSRAARPAPCAASGEPPGTSRTYGSRISSTTSNGPSGRQVGEGEVELAVLERPGARRRRRLAQRRPRSRAAASEAAEQRGEDRAADALVGADPQRAGGASRSAARSAWAAWSRATIAVGVAEQQAPGLGQVDGPRAARPLDQALRRRCARGRRSAG